MTTERRQERSHHDWHSAAYVDDWIRSDVTRDSERVPVLRRMLSLSGFEADVAIDVLDVGAGYGLMSEVVLAAFPRAHVTLQDYSTPMLEHARRRLARFADRTAYVLCDLTDAAWTKSVGGPFDLAVSVIAIHNLREAKVIASVYRGVRDVLKPSGVFLNADYVFTGGADAHVEWLKRAGFARVTADSQDERLTVFAAHAS